MGRRPGGGRWPRRAGRRGLPGGASSPARQGVTDSPRSLRIFADHVSETAWQCWACLRRDGSPRISPIEPYLGGGRLLIGAMAWPAKAGDLRRDPRYVLHSVVTGPDCGEGELKLYGSAVEAGQDLRGAAARAWWLAWPPDTAIVFSLRIGQAVFIDWDTEDGLMTVHQWSPRSFLAQMVHLIVQLDTGRAAEIVCDLNRLLAPDGWMLKPQKQWSGWAVYAPARTELAVWPRCPSPTRRRS